jgi:hypothetical protein
MTRAKRNLQNDAISTEFLAEAWLCGGKTM